MNANATYPEFDFKANQLKKYIEASGLFSILLTCGTIIHHRPVCASDFREWLRSHDIFDLRSGGG